MKISEIIETLIAVQKDCTSSTAYLSLKKIIKCLEDCDIKIKWTLDEDRGNDAGPEIIYQSIGDLIEVGIPIDNNGDDYILSNQN